MNDDKPLLPPLHPTLPVLGDPDPADPAQTLPVVGEREVYVSYFYHEFVSGERCAVVELGEDRLRRSPEQPDLGPWIFVVKLTKEVAPKDEVIVLHEHKLYVRQYEITRDGRARWRSDYWRSPTWPVGEATVQGVVLWQGRVHQLAGPDFAPRIGRDMTLPVLGDPDPADPTRELPVVRKLDVGLEEKIALAGDLAVVELRGVEPIEGYKGRDDTWSTTVYIFKRTKEAAPGDVVVVVHEDKLTVRHYEPEGNGQVRLRSAEPTCPTWVIPADEVNIEGVVLKWDIVEDRRWG